MMWPKRTTDTYTAEQMWTDHMHTVFSVFGFDYDMVDESIQMDMAEYWMDES